MDFEVRLSGQTDPEAVTPFARWAEELGAISLWSSEAGCDPFMPLVPAAMATQKIEIGTGIAVAFGRSPYATAQSAWYLHRISKGRMVLGLGTQIKAHIERRYGMPWYGAGNALAEYIDCMQEIWRSWREKDSPNFVGKHWQATLNNPEFTPAPLPDGTGPIPIWIASVGPTLLRIAARAADGVNFHPFTTPEYLGSTMHPAIEASRSEAGIVKPLRTGCCVFSGVVHDEQQLKVMRSHFRSIIAFYGSTPTYQPVLESIGYGDLMPLLHDLSREKAWAKMAELVPDDLIDRMVIMDSPADLGRKMVERYGDVLDQISIFRGGDRFMSPSDWEILIQSVRTASR